MKHAELTLPGGESILAASHNVSQVAAPPVVARTIDPPMLAPTSLRIGVLASAKFSIGPPFAGGLEGHTWHLVCGLRDRGHDVTLFAQDGPPGVTVERAGAWSPSAQARRDVASAPEAVVSEHYAHMRALRSLLGRSDLDVIHDNTAHHLPLTMGALLPAPVVTTLHTPPTPWLESAFAMAGDDIETVISVSRHNADRWAHAVDVAKVIHNGVDIHLWRPTVGVRRGAAWLGRIVPEKAPHLAIAAARRAALRIRLAGPIHDEAYFRDVLRPMLGRDAVYEGHLASTEAARLVAEAAVSLVTPMWDEPFGQVVIESLACGTPVAGFAMGALAELVAEPVARLVTPGDTTALAAAARGASELSAADCRRWACEHFSLDRMLASYEATFTAVSGVGRRTA